jgi:SAM-dependent methyltransferase
MDGTRWGVHVLDAEARYWPVIDALPNSALPLCEVGAGASGIARWTDREVIGIDPGPPERHGDQVPGPNFRGIEGSGTAIPLEDRSVAAAIAVDTMEHVLPDERAKVVDEMIRVTAPGGRVIIIGPTGPAAAEGDAWLLRTFDERGGRPPWAEWLHEHEERGLPQLHELHAWLEHPRVRSVGVRGVLNLALWKTMHLAAMGALPKFGRLHAAVYRPYADVALRYRKGPFYRYLVVAEVS